MSLESLLWIDWIGLALAAYGLVAGAVRGLTQQFSRSLVWVGAAAATGAVSGLTDGLARAISGEDGDFQAWQTWLQALVLIGLVLALGGVRRLVFGRSGQAHTLADMLLGTASGAVFAIIAWLTLWGVSLRGFDDVALLEAPGRPVYDALRAPLEAVPAAVRSPLWELPPASED